MVYIALLRENLNALIIYPSHTPKTHPKRQAKMFHKLDIVYYWYSKVDPSENDREAVQKARCTCTFCANANDRAVEECMYGTPPSP